MDERPGEARTEIEPTEEVADICPTNRFGLPRFRPGKPFPFGATIVPGGINFSVFSGHATDCALVLFEKGAKTPMIEAPFPSSFRIGQVWCMIVYGIDPEAVEYGYRMGGLWDPAVGHRFDRSKILLDPYAKAIGGRDVWGEIPDEDEAFPYRGRPIFEDFDWGDDRPLEIPMEDLIIYEMHVRGFTRHPSSGVKYPGTYAAIREKIPYLKDLGVNCIELMPVFEFDEFENAATNPLTGERLLNYWGYSTVGFFAPKAGYAATGKFGTQVDELKSLVKELHANGIEVILDVVFNHTCEGDERGPTVSFRGIDNSTYYMLMPNGGYFNFSGCGNTLNCNNPVVRNLVVDCLRYWASEYHVDGFRFDLAAVLGRDPSGLPLSNPPLLESLAFDPILGRCKLIAEAWDAGGLYQVGTFPAYGRWAEWNGRFRDDVRQCLRGDPGFVAKMAQRVQGSPDLYGSEKRGPAASINFITCHDGFTLRDLFSYNTKHNEANGEDNRDGTDENYSHNCGWEGSTDDPEINALRERLSKNAYAILLASHGVPMLLMGDELGRTQHGNNNAYCQDNEISWMDWTGLEKNAGLYRFARNMIALRKAHPVLRPREHPSEYGCAGSGCAEITWHGVKNLQPDFSESSRVLAYMLHGKRANSGEEAEDYVYIAVNSQGEAVEMDIPRSSEGFEWRLAVDTGKPSPLDIYEPGTEPPIGDQERIRVKPWSVLILVGRPLKADFSIPLCSSRNDNGY